METKRGNPKVHQCEKCDNVFLIVKSTTVGLAFPRPVSVNPISGQRLMGICPKHRRSLTE